ncbi:MAG: adenylate/guanylate cyclase domain-containing protein [Burkholderiales bacterium]|nr:adenylate/guanylate cyclase domain-containing protein [Burkholderiales bacterium]
MSVDAQGTIEALETARRTFQTISVANGGRVVDTAGDSVLAIFKTAAGATAAALAIQHELEARANAVADDRRLRFRLGLHLGDVVQKADGSVYGDGVNVAARLQSVAPAGGIVVSESIRLAVRGKVAVSFEDLGDHALKNIAEPVRAHRLLAAGPEQEGQRPPAAAAPSSLRWWQRPSGKRNALVVSATVAASALALAAYFGLGARLTTSDPSAAGLPPPPLSILVLPFANQTGDEKKAYIADAFTMSITADLSRIRDAFVVPATTAFTYGTKGLTVQQVAKDAAVRFVLGGSVLTSGQEVRVTAQLVDSKTGAQLWNETFRGELSNLFALQDQVTALVGNSIGERMVIVAARESETRKSAPQVVDLMLRARALNFRPYSMENFRERERLYREALSQEPNNVNAMVDLAATLAIHSQWMDGSDPARDKQLTDARDLALSVKAIDPSLRGIELPLYLYAQEHNDFEGARRALEAALAKDPKSPSAYGNFALFFMNMGEPERAVPLLKQALSVYPKGNEFIFDNLGLAYLALGDNDAAIEWLLRAVDLNTGILDVYSGLAIAYSNKGDRRGASRYVAEYQKRATAQGFKGIESDAPSPESPPAYLKYYYEQYLPQWKKAGLP